MSHHHVAVDHIHINAHADHNGFQGSGHGTLHGDQTDIHIGGNISHQHGGGSHGGIEGGITHHPTSDSSINIHGGYQDNGNWSVGMTGTIHF
jgi:hypothetical protein